MNFIEVLAVLVFITLLGPLSYLLKKLVKRRLERRETKFLNISKRPSA